MDDERGLDFWFMHASIWQHCLGQKARAHAKAFACERGSNKRIREIVPKLLTVSSARDAKFTDP